MQLAIRTCYDMLEQRNLLLTRLPVHPFVIVLLCLYFFLNSASFKPATLSAFGLPSLQLC